MNKKQRVSFGLDCTVNELNNLPYVSGFYYIKWRVIGAAGKKVADKVTEVANAASKGVAGAIGGARGVTPRAIVKDHSVSWNCPLRNLSSNSLDPILDPPTPTSPNATIDLLIAKDKDGTLTTCDLLLTVKQEANGGRTADTIGTVTIHLSELARQSSPISKRYLLQDSKVNATLTVTIAMRLAKPSAGQEFHAPNHSSSTLKHSISIEAIHNLFSHEAQKQKEVEHFRSTGQLLDSFNTLENVHEVYDKTKSLSISSRLAGRNKEIGATDAVNMSFYDDSFDDEIVERLFAEAVKNHLPRGPVCNL
ncbi:hypothetical protein HDU98_001547 [Podochytrium sp. JEL0797]|nr:hypothetical protein HDU98_001547 [Podochytrium sp. JEL0797]